MEGKIILKRLLFHIIEEMINFLFFGLYIKAKSSLELVCFSETNETK